MTRSTIAAIIFVWALIAYGGPEPTHSANAQVVQQIAALKAAPRWKTRRESRKIIWRKGNANLTYHEFEENPRYRGRALDRILPAQEGDDQTYTFEIWHIEDLWGKTPDKRRGFQAVITVRDQSGSSEPYFGELYMGQGRRAYAKAWNDGFALLKQRAEQETQAESEPQ